jgi:regulator of nonsense transcripts 2
MDSALLKGDEEKARHARRVKLRELNAAMDVHGQS